MRFGCCVGPEAIAIIAEAGFDFCELPARAVLPMEDDAAALPTMRMLAIAPLQAEAFNVLVPGELPLCGPMVDRAALQRYLERAFRRMAQLGGKIAVLGSGAARRIPDGWPRDQAMQQLAESFAMIGEYASKNGITIAVEHLNSGECNVFNTIAESQNFLEQYQLHGLQLLADIYHLELEHEPLANVRHAGERIVHVHVAGGGRQAPNVPGYDYAGLMATLHTIGYDARISAECSWQDLEQQAPAALAFMRSQWESPMH